MRTVIELTRIRQRKDVTEIWDGEPMVFEVRGNVAPVVATISSSQGASDPAQPAVAPSEVFAEDNLIIIPDAVLDLYGPDVPLFYWIWEASILPPEGERFLRCEGMIWRRPAHAPTAPPGIDGNLTHILVDDQFVFIDFVPVIL